MNIVNIETLNLKLADKLVALVDPTYPSGRTYTGFSFDVTFTEVNDDDTMRRHRRFGQLRVHASTRTEYLEKQIEFHRWALLTYRPACYSFKDKPYTIASIQKPKLSTDTNSIALNDVIDGLRTTEIKTDPGFEGMHYVDFRLTQWIS